MNNGIRKVGKTVGIPCVKILAWVLLLYKTEIKQFEKT